MAEIKNEQEEESKTNRYYVDVRKWELTLRHLVRCDETRSRNAWASVWTEGSTSVLSEKKLTSILIKDQSVQVPTPTDSFLVPKDWCFLIRKFRIWWKFVRRGGFRGILQSRWWWKRWSEFMVFSSLQDGISNKCVDCNFSFFQWQNIFRKRRSKPRFRHALRLKMGCLE